MSTISNIQAEILSDLALFDDFNDKLQYVMDLGDNIPNINEADRVDENLINGCQSKMWISAKLENGKVFYFGDSDSPFPKGLAALYIKIMSGNMPNEIIKTEISILKDSGLIYNLSPIRQKGVSFLVLRMKELASKYLD